MKSSLSHTHPLAYIEQPEILNQDRSSVIEIVTRILYAALPTIMCFQFNITTTLINLYFIDYYTPLNYFVAVGVGYVVTNVLGFILLESMNLSFAATCMNLATVKDAKSSEAIGLMYQKTLVVNFFLCIIITPFLYLSDKILLNIGLDAEIVTLSTQYVWGLVPSFYLYAFYDTTRNYLQSQGQLYAPIVIQAISSACHYSFAFLFIGYFNNGLSGAIWAKNLSDTINCLLLYIYIIYWQPTKQSWIQWNIKAASNWTIFIQILLSIGIASFLQNMAYQIMTIVAAHLMISSVAAHILISNTAAFIFMIYLGLSHCISYAFYTSLRQNKMELAKKKFNIGLFIMLAISSFIVLQMYFYREQWFILVTQQQQAVHQLRRMFPLILLILFLQSIHTCLSGFLRCMDQGKKVLWVYLISFYLIGIASSISLTFGLQLGLLGIWLGWLISLVISLIWFTCILYSKQWSQISEELVIVQNQMRQNMRKSIYMENEEDQKDNNLLKSNIVKPDIELRELKDIKKNSSVEKQKSKPVKKVTLTVPS